MDGRGQQRAVYIEGSIEVPVLKTGGFVNFRSLTFSVNSYSPEQSISKLWPHL